MSVSAAPAVLCVAVWSGVCQWLTPSPPPGRHQRAAAPVPAGEEDGRPAAGDVEPVHAAGGHPGHVPAEAVRHHAARQTRTQPLRQGEAGRGAVCLPAGRWVGRGAVGWPIW